MLRRLPPLILFMIFALVVSFIGTKDRFTWLLETLPVMMGALLIARTSKSFPLTPLLTLAIAAHVAILCLGGHYTYAEVPFGFWMQETFGFARNHYDRIGHFFQGFVPALIAREILIRKNVVNGSVWRFVIVSCICLAFSAFYELIEWWAAIATGEGAQAFLGTQGDPWDSQWDMFFCLIGALTAQILLSQRQAQQIRELESPRSKTN